MFQITAAITTYRREWDCIERAIISIEKQTHSVCELLLVDDNPGGAYSEEIARKIARHPSVRVLSDGKNHGVSLARNTAIREAQGDFIAFLDDDDEWLPDKIENQIMVLEKHPSAALIFGKGMKETKNGMELTWSSTIFKEHPTYHDMLKMDHVGSASHPLIRVDVAKELGGFIQMPAVEDYEFWIRIAKKYEIWGCDKVLYTKHMPKGRHVSGNHERTFHGYERIYQENQSEYDADIEAKIRIYYNMIRRGVMAKTPEVLPYLAWWFVMRAKYRVTERLNHAQ